MLGIFVKDRSGQQLLAEQWSSISSSVSNVVSRLQPNKDASLHQADLAVLLRRCAFSKLLSDGTLLHHYLTECVISPRRFIHNLLLQMYGNCGDLESAFSVFDRIRTRDVFSWNFIVKSSVQQGHFSLAVELLDRMQQESNLPDRILLINILPACNNVHESNKLLVRLVGSGHRGDLSVATTLIKLYGKYGHIECAREVFDTASKKDTVLWTAIIAIYSQNKFTNSALIMFNKMALSGVDPDDVTFVSVLSACAAEGYLIDGMIVHAFIVDASLESDISLKDALLNLYSKCKALDEVYSLFGSMDVHETASWTAVIAAYTQSGLAKWTIQAFEQMHQEGTIPSKITYMSVFGACDNCQLLKVGTAMHARAACLGLPLDITMYNALISMYAKCGSAKKAFSVLQDMPGKDVTSWNSMIHGFTNHDCDKEALQLYKQMVSEGNLPDAITFVRVLDALSSPCFIKEGKQTHVSLLGAGQEQNVVVATSLLNMYKNCGDLKSAGMLFRDMAERDTVAWNAFIEANSESSNEKNALQLYEQMQQEVVLPQYSTYISVLSACAKHGGLAECKWTHAKIATRSLAFDLKLGNALLNTYAKCGRVDEAQRIFQDMPVKDIFSWNTILAAFAQNGQAKAALELVPSMIAAGIVPNGVTFVSVLSACSHAGLLCEASQFLSSMDKDYGFKLDVEHHNCIIDLLGRAGRLDEAEKWIKEMSWEATTVSWLILLNACKQYVDVWRGKNAAEQVIRMDPQDATPYILLSNVYADAGRNEEATAVIKRMLGKGLKLQPNQAMFEAYSEEEILSQTYSD